MSESKLPRDIETISLQLKSIQEKLDENEKTISGLKEENRMLNQKVDKIEGVLKSARPLRHVFQRTFPIWFRYIHTDEEFIQSHLNMMWEDGGCIGFALMNDPNTQL